jgi:hypothetical protein
MANDKFIELNKNVQAIDLIAVKMQKRRIIN